MLCILADLMNSLSRQIFIQQYSDRINKINQGNPTLLCLFCQYKYNCIYSDLERSTSIFDLGSMSKGDLTRSYCISFDASMQEELCKTYPRSLCQFSIQPKVISKNARCHYLTSNDLSMGHICKVAPRSSTVTLLSMVLNDLNRSDKCLRHLSLSPIDL